MILLEKWKMSRFIKRASRLMEACVRYYNEAERYAMKNPDCKKFRGLSLMDESMTIVVDIRKIEEEAE